MKRFVLLLLLFVFLCLTSDVNAKTLTPLEGLEAIKRSFSGINDFTAEMTQEKQLAIMKKKLVMQGTVRFRRPDRFMMQLAPPYPGKVLLKDNLLEQRLGVKGELQRITLPPEHGLARWFSTVLKPVNSLPEGMSVRAEQLSGVTTVVIRPSGDGQLREISLQIQEDGVIRRLVLEEKNGDRTVMTFRNTRRNIGLTEADFRME